MPCLLTLGSVAAREIQLLDYQGYFTHSKPKNQASPDLMQGFSVVCNWHAAVAEIS